jgi:single-strand DNA-binding protein
MNEITVTVVGNLASDVRLHELRSRTPMASFRLASCARVFDRARNEWGDGPTSYFSVFCWNALAENVTSSLSKGQPVVVTGRLTTRAWEQEGRHGTSLEIKAFAVGHDLSRGTGTFRRRSRAGRGEDVGARLDEIALELATATPLAEPAGPSQPAPDGAPSTPEDEQAA